ATSDSGQVVGTVSSLTIGEKEAHLRGMAVRPSWHGLGVADALLKATESELRERKCSCISLDTTEPLKRAVRFYARNGFRPSGKVTDYFGIPLFEHIKTLE
ncbi:MAG TPA: GNAT family N-acetyltransferase, partial [Thermoanaerobaculia bacterium]|nr:GNAT family N-acetyltransferase [Thermoanaerobaculia bacterium]